MTLFRTNIEETISNLEQVKIEFRPLAIKKKRNFFDFYAGSNFKDLSKHVYSLIL